MHYDVTLTCGDIVLRPPGLGRPAESDREAGAETPH